MNKKQRNRKLVNQNKRNRMINRYYSSTVKTLWKLFLTKRKMNGLEVEKELQGLSNNLYSMLDKAVKKHVIHQNTASRKKSRIGHYLVDFKNKQ